MQTLSTAQAVVSMLELNGIDTLFCLPGVQNDSFFDALYDRTNAIRPVHTRHEQACAYMALGYAMASGKPSAYMVVPGPGFLNTTAALSTAYAANAPVLALTGQIQQSMIGRNIGLLHELPDQLSIMRGLTKWADRINAPSEAPGLVNEAFRRLLSGRRRPVALECAMDTWGRKAPVVLPTVNPLSVLFWASVTPSPPALVSVGSPPAVCKVKPPTVSASFSPHRIWPFSSVMPPVYWPVPLRT